MKPLANCLDRLQTEEKAYLGVLLPTLTLMRVALERMEEARGDQALTYAKPLVRALLRQEGNKGGFNNRFSAMFKDLDLLMASALHPNYGMTTFNSVAPNMKEEIFQRIVKEMKALIRQETRQRETTARTWRQWRSMRRSAPTHLQSCVTQPRLTRRTT
ncbi:hypothetical protein GWK47_053584 [Chionoecetes opilio]|uniref:Uncharacterized protein n=1 Tax=Chionoecetes opilio TaxID=41210 RepID=A0A8J4Y5Y6_CHIOP|nr:hypothetical protein GWK47_053584 [Chionoecetes opilio]